MLTLFERIAGALARLLTASLSVLRAIRRDYYGDQLSWWAVNGPSVILHVTFNFGTIVASALEGNVGWIHPTGLRNTVMIAGQTGMEGA